MEHEATSCSREVKLNSKVVSHALEFCDAYGEVLRWEGGENRVTPGSAKCSWRADPPKSNAMFSLKEQGSLSGLQLLKCGLQCCERLLHLAVRIRFCPLSSPEGLWWWSEL